MTANTVLIFKITTAPAWAAAVDRGVFAGSPDDVRDGYIHLSSQDQLAGTAVKYFAGVEDLVLVAVEAEQLGDRLKWESSRGGALFPHCYGALPVAAALWVRPLPLDKNGVPCVAETRSQ